MLVRKGSAEWNGDLKGGRGKLSSESGALNNIDYNFVSRFEQGNQTNPEELIGAAHSACFSMAFANILSGEGFKVNSIKTEDKVHLEKQDAGFTLTKIEMDCVGDVEGCDESKFKELAEKAKANCPVSRALKIDIALNASLK